MEKIIQLAQLKTLSCIKSKLSRIHFSFFDLICLPSPLPYKTIR